MGSQPRSKYPLPDIPPTLKPGEDSAVAKAQQARQDRFNAIRLNRPGRTLVAQDEKSVAALMKVPPARITMSQKGGFDIKYASAREVIAEHTDNGLDIIRFMVNSMQGKVDGIKGRARLAAAEFLALHLYGKPCETTLQLSMQQGTGAMPNIDDDELEKLARGLISGTFVAGATEVTQQAPDEAVTEEAEPDSVD